MLSNNFLPINKRVFIFLLAGLLALHGITAAVIAQKFSRPGGQRMPSDDLETIALWVDQVKQCSGYKVVILGDSVIHGQAVASGLETLPAYIAEELRQRLPDRDVHVFNLGMPGGAPAEVYFVLDALAGSGVDLFIYNINMAWFARENTLDHPAVTRLKGVPHALDLTGLGIQTEELNHTPAEEWFAQHVLNYWQPYRYRILINYWLWGKPLREKIEDAKKDIRLILPFAEEKLPETIEMRRRWYEKDWEGKLDPDEGRVGAFYLTGENKQWVFYRMLLDTAGRESIPLVLFITPRNYELLERYDMIDRPAYSKNLSIVLDAASSAGFPVLDYGSSIPYENFSDIVHLLPEGNKILANKITLDLFDQGYIKR